MYRLAPIRGEIRERGQEKTEPIRPTLGEFIWRGLGEYGKGLPIFDNPCKRLLLVFSGHF